MKHKMMDERTQQNFKIWAKECISQFQQNLQPPLQSFIMSAVSISPQAIEQCRATIEDPNSEPEKVYAMLKAVRGSLCNHSFQQQIAMIMGSNLHISIFNYAAYQINLISNATEIPPLYVQILQECLWIFTNLCMDNTGKTQELVHLGIIHLTDLTLQLVKYPPIVQCTLQLIGNLVAEQSLEIKLAYLKSSTFGLFYLNYANHFWEYKGTCDQTITWVLSNAFRRIHLLHPPMDIIKPLIVFYLNIVSNLITYPTDNLTTIANLYHILAYMTQDWDYYYPEIHQIIKDKFDNSPDQLKKTILDIYGNMASQSDFGVKVIIQNDSMISFMLNQLKNKKPKGVHKRQNKVYAWILSNVLAGTVQQIDYFLNNHSTFFNEMHEILQASDSYTTIKELIWAICNMLQSCSIQAFQLIYYSNILTILSQKVSYFILSGHLDSLMARVYLEGIQSYIQKHSQEPDKFTFQNHQKTVIIQTLKQIQSFFSSQAETTRLENSIAYLQSIQTIEEMAALSIVV